MNKYFPLLRSKGLLMGFVSGRCVVIGEEVGLTSLTPPYLAPTTTGDVILKGVNYASSASGILNDTERFFGHQIHLDTQISNFVKTRQDIISRIGSQAAKEQFKHAIFFVSIGSNDIIFSQWQNSSSWNTLLDTIISRYKSQLVRLYNLDARKFIVTNSAAVGCIPFVRDLHSSVDSCVAVMNQKAQLFNSRLDSLLAELTKNLEASTFICANVYAMLDEILNNYMTSYDFEVADSACCHIAGAGLHGGLIPCGILSQVCPDRSKYVFWDPFHLTETSYEIIAKHMMDGSALQTVFLRFLFLVDAGNNNYIVSLSKANYIPNGIDFGRPTGRYYCGQELGFEDFTPPFLAPTTMGSVVLRGVNYASGGGGILNYTGKIFGGRINLDAQIDNFANTRQDIIASIGAPATPSLLKMSLFEVVIGSNDFISNYLTPVVSAVNQKVVPPDVFVDTVVARFRLQLTRLYNLGARKIFVANVGPIGCIPYQRDTNPAAGDNCVSFSDQIAQLYNTELRSLITELGANLEGSNFVYADVYRIVNDILQNYRSYGFENANASRCYAAGHFGGLIPCGPPSKVCFDRSKYLFWDPYHPSDAANVIIFLKFVIKTLL
ncbi:hypothetical protein POTOM_031519 [Populus tomentosa]|uniref:Uncharacterized protein n=1 Tax=Populus tomentosa TaxID=118781 RepID=A0A8X8CRZ8_POPTO|nr:hypothetical protein POTOM_031519 [Populus tomentosa]